MINEEEKSDTMKRIWDRQAIIDLFRENANEEQAGPMRAYMRNKFRFLGIKSPLRKELLQQFFKAYELPKDEHLFREIEAIYKMPEREFQYVAIAMLAKKTKHLKIDDLAFCESLIIEKSWWDSVDAIAPKIVGSIVLSDRVQGEKVMQQWSASNNMWLNRSAILHQLKYKTLMNEKLLYEIIREHIDSKEFFIQKAIGWVLREYAKTNAESVLDFVNQTNLQVLSRREALKNL